MKHSFSSRFLLHRLVMLLFGFALLAVLCMIVLLLPDIGHWQWLVLLIFSLLFLALLFLAYRFVFRPYRASEKILMLFSEQYTMQSVFDLRSPYTPALEKAFSQMQIMLDSKEWISATRKHAELLALQNQINPHFLYNTLEGIRSEALIAGLDTVAEMTEALASFFRYTISKLDQLVTLEDELENIETYFIIQQFRFGERLRLRIVYDESDWKALFKCKLPKLTLQPIVENAIVHGIERKIAPGQITIRLDMTEKRLMIRILDDGVGMDEETLLWLNKRLNAISFDYIKPQRDGKGGIALLNVNNRIRLLFGEEYGICVQSKQNVGTDVELTLPRIGETNENEKGSVAPGESHAAE